jgi:hypothetical protein
MIDFYRSSALLPKMPFSPDKNKEEEKKEFE